MSAEKNTSFRIPEINKDMKEGMLDYWKLQEAHATEMNEKIIAIALQIPDFAPIIKNMPKELMKKNNREGIQRSRRAFEHGEWEAYFQNMRGEGEHYARMGVGFSAWIELLRRYKDEFEPFIAAEFSKDPKRMMAASSAMNELLYLSIEVIGGAYLVTKEAVIRSQEDSIRELSTPVLKVRERQLIVPIIGIIDTQRARQVTESMLKAIRDHRALVVVMDITGVPMVDSKVANHLVQSVEAARLMGSVVVITGLSPEIAQTLVALGASLPNVKTFGDLQGGMEEAEKMLGLAAREA